MARLIFITKVSPLINLLLADTNIAKIERNKRRLNGELTESQKLMRIKNPTNKPNYFPHQ